MEAIEKTMTAGYGRDRLDRVFKLVQNPDDWKAEIDTEIEYDHPDICGDLKVVREAVIFFTGTEPTFFIKAFPKCRVLALGYRNGPCGP